jgi:hypothetical protein
MSNRTGLLVAAAILGMALILWTKSNVGTADDNWLSRSGGSYGPIQVLSPVY